MDYLTAKVEKNEEKAESCYKIGVEYKKIKKLQT